MLFGPSAFQLRTNIDKKVSPGRSKIKQTSGQHLDPILNRFWSQLGLISVRFWRPSWAPNRPEINQKTICAAIENMIKKIFQEREVQEMLQERGGPLKQFTNPTRTRGTPVDTLTHHIRAGGYGGGSAITHDIDWCIH